MKRTNWLPAPQAYLLNQMCVIINQALGSYGCYLVGSALTKRDYRDVDVRFIMKDEAYDVLFGTDRPAHMHPLWSLMCTSVSLFLQTHTGLPVDFQIQQMTRANVEDPDGARHPLGVFICPTPRDYASDLAQPEPTPPAPQEIAAPEKEWLEAPKCPGCGSEFEGQEIEYDGDEREIECGNCGMFFDVGVSVERSYRSTARGECPKK